MTQYMNNADDPIKYTIKRSNRRSIGLQITSEGLLVRAPLRATQAEIDAVIHKHRRWIRTHLAQARMQEQEAVQEGLLSEEDLRVLSKRARDYLTARVNYFAPLVGVSPGRIAIRTQKTRWGSCSAKGNLNFNCLLMLTPPEVIDSVVVHELCHLKELNHSPSFYAEVYRVFPEYDKWHRWLREHGGAIMKRVVK